MCDDIPRDTLPVRIDVSDKYPPIPDEYKPFVREGIEKAQEILDDPNSKDSIPGHWGNNDSIPPELVEAYIWRESQFNPTAVNQGYCNQYGGHATGLGQFCLNPGGDVGGSLELSNYQDVTGDRLSSGDIYDPKKAIMLVAFGLGDRYERLRGNKDSYDNWYMAVEGMSPVPGQSSEYRNDLYQYIAANYGTDRALAIQQNAGEGFKSDSCNSYKFYDPRRYSCTAELALKTGQNAVKGGEQWQVNLYEKYLKRFGILLAGVMAVVLGVMLLAKKPGMEFIKNNPEVLAAL